MTKSITDLPNYVPGRGNSSARLMVVGMAPGAEENDTGEPFVGPTGKLTREMLAIGGMKDIDVYFTNVEKYRPPNDKLGLFKTINRRPFQDLDQLYNEIEAINPNCILILGEHALKGVVKKKGIKKWRGSILSTEIKGKTYKVVSSYHPSALLRAETEETKAFSYSARAYMQLDFNRAIKQSKFKEIKLPKRLLEYATDSEQLRRFIHKYKHDKGLRRVSIDIETTKGSCIPTCIGIAFTSTHGLSIPLLNVGGGVRTDDIEQVKMIRFIQTEILGDQEIELIGQNIKFDLDKLIKVFGFVIRAKVFFDVGMAAHVLYPEFPKALEFLTSTWTEEPYYKDELKEFDPERDSFEQILIYNAKDVCVPFEIYEKELSELEERNLTDFFFDLIMPLSNFYMEVQRVGMEFDRELRDQLVLKYRQLEDELETRLEHLIGYRLDIGSTKKVTKLLFEELELPKRKDTKEDTLVALLGNHAKDNPIKYAVIDAILDLRKVKRLLNGPLASEPDYDGKMRTVFNINAATNGRTGANLVKPPERPGLIIVTDKGREYHKTLGMQAHNLSKHGEFGPEIRKYLTPSKGKIFFQADKSQAEARVVAALAKDDWRLSLFDMGKDVHSITASWFFNKEIEGRPEDPENISGEERFIGKTGSHALAYDARPPKLMLTINKLARKFNIPVVVSLQEAKLFRYIFHRKSPKIENIFYREVIEAYKRGGKKRLVAASGRERQFFGYFDANLLYSYIPSASVADDTKFGAVRAKRRIPQLEIVNETHDAILVQCYPSELDEFAAIVKEEFERPLDLSRCSLPRDPIIIPCDIEVGENYMDLKKIKLAV